MNHHYRSRLAVTRNVLSNLYRVISHRINGGGLQTTTLLGRVNGFGSHLLNIAVSQYMNSSGAITLSIVKTPNVMRTWVMTRVFNGSEAIGKGCLLSVRDYHLLRGDLCLYTMLASSASVMTTYLTDPVLLCVRHARLARTINERRGLIDYVMNGSGLKPICRQYDGGNGNITAN